MTYTYTAQDANFTRTRAMDTESYYIFAPIAPPSPTSAYHGPVTVHTIHADTRRTLREFPDLQTAVDYALGVLADINRAVANPEHVMRLSLFPSRGGQNLVTYHPKILDDPR